MKKRILRKTLENSTTNFGMFFSANASLKTGNDEMASDTPKMLMGKLCRLFAAEKMATLPAASVEAITVLTSCSICATPSPSVRGNMSRKTLRTPDSLQRNCQR